MNSTGKTKTNPAHMTAAQARAKMTQKTCMVSPPQVS
jgi:hypothetical protein